MLTKRRKSDWTFDTSSSGSMSYGFVGVGTGTITLKSPAGVKNVFRYESIGAGASLGVPDMPDVGLSFSTEDNLSAGQIWILDQLPHYELTSDDIEGYCVIEEFSLSARDGASFTVMILGYSLKGLARGVAFDVTKLFSPLLGYKIDELDDQFPGLLDTSATAILFMGGLNTGGVSAGVMGSVGRLSTLSVEQVRPEIDVPAREDLDVSYGTTGPNDPDFINIPGDALFDFDKDDWNDSKKPQTKVQAEKTLTQVGAIIQKSSRRPVMIYGHTDGIGDRNYNQGLSERRAKTVAQWLTSRNYLKAADVRTGGYGMDRPVQPNKNRDGSDNSDGRKKNRRVEVILGRKQ